MKTLILATLMTLSTIAQASDATKTLSCSFTEPFFTLEVDLVKKEVTRIDWDWNDQDPKSDYITTVVASDVQITTDISDPFSPKYKLLAKDGALIADLALDMQGSDGMSDLNFPISIIFDGMYAGCTTEKMGAFSPPIQP